MFELTQSFYFEAAHTLQRNIEREGSRRIHGHTYYAEVTVSGEPDRRTGMIVDLGLIRLEIGRVREALDHVFLDEVTDLGPATLENLCFFIYCQLNASLPGVCAISVARLASGDRCVLRPDQRANQHLVQTNDTLERAAC
jgi:6-pyruvoyltetrahydropterin/6-carboxytetrahydropterin synthase